MKETTIHIVDLLKDRKQTLVTAESCTGGLIAVQITNIPSAGEIYLGSVVSYSENAKISILQVPKSAITNYGVVSEQVARLMALGVKHKFNAHWALSTTGYAGPSGGTPHAPIGTLCIGVSGPLGTKTTTFRFKNLSRELYCQHACEHALDFLMTEINKIKSS